MKPSALGWRPLGLPQCLMRLSFFTILDNVVQESAVLDPAFNVVRGTREDDVLVGTDDRDEILGDRGNDLIVSGSEDDLLVGGEGRDRFAMTRGSGTDTIIDFGGVGDSSNLAAVETIDRLEFFGEGFTAENLFLTQDNSDLKVSFEGIDDSQVVLQNFELELIDNMPCGVGNILFDGQRRVKDSCDVMAADSEQSTILNRDTVTFLNDLDNAVSGFENSDDTINAQGGDDKLFGLSGNDLLGGGEPVTIHSLAVAGKIGFLLVRLERLPKAIWVSI